MGFVDSTPAEPAAPPPASDKRADVSSYNDLLVARLQDKADEYFKLGLAYFREGEYVKSRQHFELARQIDRDLPRAYLAEMIVSFQRADFNTAVVRFKHGLQRAKSLDDLRLDWKEFYSTPQEFQRVVDAASLLSNSPNVRPGMKLLLAYYTWLNGDLDAAISVAKSAEREMEAVEKRSSELLNLIDERRGREEQLFSQFLIEARDQRQAATTGDQD